MYLDYRHRLLLDRPIFFRLRASVHIVLAIVEVDGRSTKPTRHPSLGQAVHRRREDIQYLGDIAT